MSASKEEMSRKLNSFSEQMKKVKLTEEQKKSRYSDGYNDNLKRTNNPKKKNHTHKEIPKKSALIENKVKDLIEQKYQVKCLGKMTINQSNAKTCYEGFKELHQVVIMEVNENKCFGCYLTDLKKEGKSVIELELKYVDDELKSIKNDNDTFEIVNECKDDNQTFYFRINTKDTFLNDVNFNNNEVIVLHFK